MGEGAAVKYENHFLRLFCAVVVMLVTFVHYNPNFTVMGYSVVDLVYGIGRFAMPIFFMVSGYFLFSKDGHSEAGIKRKIIHVVVLILIMKLAYFIVDLFRLGSGLIDVNQLITNTIIADPNYGVHSWFVYALLIMYIVWWGFMKFKLNTVFLLWLGAILLAIDIVVGEFLPICGVKSLGFMGPVELGEIMYPFIAVFSFAIGYHIHKSMDVINDRYSTKMLLALLAFGIVLTCVEVIASLNCGAYGGADVGHPGPNMYIGSVIMMFTVFILSFRLKENQFRCRVLEFMGRRMLPWMYAFMFIGTCMIKEFQWFDPNNFIMYNVVGLVLAILIDLVLAFLVYLLLKYLGKRFAGRKAAAA